MEFHRGEYIRIRTTLVALKNTYAPKSILDSQLTHHLLSNLESPSDELPPEVVDTQEEFCHVSSITECGAAGPNENASIPVGKTPEDERDSESSGNTASRMDNKDCDGGHG